MGVNGKWGPNHMSRNFSAELKNIQHNRPQFGKTGNRGLEMLNF